MILLHSQNRMMQGTAMLPSSSSLLIDIRDVATPPPEALTTNSQEAPAEEFAPTRYTEKHKTLFESFCQTLMKFTPLFMKFAPIL